MTLTTKPSRFLSSLILGSVLTLGLSACSDDHGDHDHDEAHLMFVTAPGTTLTAGQDEAVTWMVHTEGDLHHTEIRACMGHRNDCGNDGLDTFDENFMGTKNGDNYEGMVNIPTAGPWTIVVFAHVGETPHISEAIHATVEPDPDAAHLMFVTAPGTTLTAGQDEAVSWMVHTEGALHHTEVRACMGHNNDCGNGGMDTFDENFAGTKNGDNYEGTVNIPTAGPWTIVVFAHVGETPHTSEAIHATVE